MRPYIVQYDRQAQPIESGSAAAMPTLLYALGSVSMIWPICSHKRSMTQEAALLVMHMQVYKLGMQGVRHIVLYLH